MLQDGILSTACVLVRLEAPLHLRLLTTLCNDVVNGSALRAEFAARIDEAAQMQTQHRQQLAEVGCHHGH